jgi:hypothetical protein
MDADYRRMNGRNRNPIAPIYIGIALYAVILSLAALLCGCKTEANRYPLDQFLDPVTEQVPNVITNR